MKPEDYQNFIEAIDFIISHTKAEIKRTKQDLKNAPNSLLFKQRLDNLKSKLENDRALRRRAKCRLYDYNYYHRKREKKIKNNANWQTLS